MNSFDQAAATYDRFALVQRDLAAWLADWLPAEKKGAALEVAAGTGFFTSHLTPWTGSLIATDISPAMIQRGERQCPEVTWRIADANNLPHFAFDWIFSSSFLQWAQEPAAMLSHWHSRLRPGGSMIAGLLVEPTLPELWELAGNLSPLPWRSAEVWKTALREAGLNLVRAETESRVFSYPSAFDLFASLRGTGAAPQVRLGPGRLRAIMTEYNRCFGRESKVIATWTFFRFEATAPLSH
jgi:malonyl-CoA O-methyltransferase